jgi:predicted nucleic acid-binding protein
MRRFLLDTNSAGDYVSRRHETWEKARQAEARGDRVGICVPVLGELWAGIELSKTKERNLPRLQRALSTSQLWPFESAAAREYGRIHAVLKSQGHKIPQIDMPIAAVAIVLGNFTVVTKDKHFSLIPGLKVENWAKP